MESLSRSSREKVAAQSVKVIKTLLTTQSTSGPTAENLRLTLPFSGTIYISRGLPPNNTPDSNEAASIPLPTHLTTSQYQQSIQNATQHQATASQHSPMQNWPSLPSGQRHATSPAVSYFTNQVWPWDQSVGGVCGAREVDAMHFDGLLDMNTDGDWMF
jgi:hypothetical protein